MSESVPVVSVILVNYKGADDTIECLKNFREIDWPREALQLIVVDNDSQDGSDEEIRAAVPEAEVYQSGANLGFAGGCNFGVEKARGDFVGFINSDAKPHPNWIKGAISAFEDNSIGAVASKVLNWEGTHIDFVDAGLTWFGMGYKLNDNQPDDERFAVGKDVLFATGSAMFVRTDLYRELGGFDERFFMFYEDVDLGWRLNVAGHRVRFVPESIAYHRHHASIKKFGSYREMYLLERNALMAMYKNLGDDLLRTTFGGALSLAIKRAMERAKEMGEPGPLVAGGTASDEVAEHKVGLTAAYGADYFLEMLPSLIESRKQIQGGRVRSDDEILPLFRKALEPAFPLEDYLRAHDLLVQVLGIDKAVHMASKVLVVTGDTVSEKMAGPAIRAWEMATALARACEVRLISTTVANLTEGPGFSVHTADATKLPPHVDWADVIIFQGHLLNEAPWIAGQDKVIVADIYDPFHLEQLEQARDLGEQGRRNAILDTTFVLNNQLQRADLMLCASDKQKAFWLGQAAVMGRANLPNHMQHGSLAEMIKVVPFGLGDEPPVQTKHGIRGVVDGIGMDDKVILWGGGVYNWFDPLTLVKAVDRLAKRHSNVRLYFLGLKHPNPAVPEMRVAWELRQLSDTLRLTGKHVFFNDGWVPYNERANWLLDADVGVSTHFEHVETAYSFRTRILDYLWAGLPIVATTGDSFGNVLDSEGIGIGVPPEDVDALEAALEKMLYDDEAAASARTNVQRFAERFRWNRVLEPVLAFATRPKRAADLKIREANASAQPPESYYVPNSWRRDLQLAIDYFRAGGASLVFSKAGGRLRKVWRTTVDARRGIGQ